MKTSPENFFGEAALPTGEPRNATVRAVTDVEVLELSRDGFDSSAVRRLRDYRHRLDR